MIYTVFFGGLCHLALFTSCQGGRTNYEGGIEAIKTTEYCNFTDLEPKVEIDEECYVICDIRD